MSHYEKIYCNRCGKEITGISKSDNPDCLHVKKQWGYFSNKDMEIHEWSLCEECYDAFVNTFTIPVQNKEVLEL